MVGFWSYSLALPRRVLVEARGTGRVGVRGLGLGAVPEREYPFAQEPVEESPEDPRGVGKLGPDRELGLEHCRMRCMYRWAGGKRRGGCEPCAGRPAGRTGRKGRKGKDGRKAAAMTGMQTRACARLSGGFMGDACVVGVVQAQQQLPNCSRSPHMHIAAQIDSNRAQLPDGRMTHCARPPPGLWCRTPRLPATSALASPSSHSLRPSPASGG